MAQPIAPDYGQRFIFPPALEDWVPVDHPVRFIREFIDQLDLVSLKFAMPTALAGRPPYHPSLLLKIWIYGYFQKIYATRKLETACGDNLPMMWLAATLKPDHNSIWRFWNENKKAIREIFKQTVKVAVQTGAVGLLLQAVDGTKLESVASGYSGWSQKHMEKLLAAVEKTLDETEAKVTEANATLDLPGMALPKALTKPQALREEIKKGLEQVARENRNHYHPIEPDARRMNVSGRNRYAYNAQAVADAKEGIVVANEITREETDAGQLAPMMEQARQNVGSSSQQPLTLADGGYGAGADLQAAAQQGNDVLVPPAQGKPSKDNAYAAKHFKYDASARTVTCPQGRTLDYEGKTTKEGEPVERYRCRHRDCPVRHLCTKDPKGRQITVRSCTPVVQAMRQRLAEPDNKKTYDQRSAIIEPRFAQIKQNDGFRRWTVWGIEAVRTQWSLLCTTLNLRILYRLWRTNFGHSPSPVATFIAVPA
jgi:transposase